MYNVFVSKSINFKRVKVRVYFLNTSFYLIISTILLSYFRVNNKDL